MLTSRLTATDREMFALAIPALGALIAEPLYVLADTAVVGNIGTAELGGLGLAAQVIGTVLSISLCSWPTAPPRRSPVYAGGGQGQRDAANQAVQGSMDRGSRRHRLRCHLLRLRPPTPPASPSIR